MPPQQSQPWEALRVSDILNALEPTPELVIEDPDRYLVIPGKNGPRWIIPAASRSSESVLRAWRPYSCTAQVKWFAIRMATRAGLVQLFPSVSSVTISRKSLLRWLERSGIAARAGEMVILVGSPSPYGKLIVFLLDETHNVAAVLKVGINSGGRASILREAEVLRQLEQYCWAPNILSVHPDIGAASQEYVHGTMAERAFRPAYLDLLCYLPQSGGSVNLGDFAHAMSTRLGPFADAMCKIAPDLLNRCLSCIDVNTSVPTMLVHGDFAPWNIRSTLRAGYVLVDWEWANFAGLPMHDLLHFEFGEDLIFGGRGGGYAAIRKKFLCTEYLTRMDLDPELLPQLVITYLLDQLDFDCKHQAPGATAAYLSRQLALVID